MGCPEKAAPRARWTGRSLTRGLGGSAIGVRRRKTLLDGGASRQTVGRGPAPPFTCGSRPPTRSRTCNTTACAATPRAPASRSSGTTATSPSRAGREGRPGLNALMAAARNREIDCVLVWKFDRFARSTRHLLVALEEFDHLGVRFVSVQDQVDTDSPMGRAMFTIIGAMAELESSLISERVTAGMRAAEARGRHLGRPATPPRVVGEIKALATSTDLSVRQIHEKIAGRASRSIVGEITKRVRRHAAISRLVTTFYTYPEPTPSSEMIPPLPCRLPNRSPKMSARAGAGRAARRRAAAAAPTSKERFLNASTPFRCRAPPPGAPPGPATGPAARGRSAPGT